MDALTCMAIFLACLGVLGSLVLYVRYGANRQLSVAARAIRMGGAIFLQLFSLLFGVLAWMGWNWEFAVCAGSFFLIAAIVASIANYMKLEMLEAKGRRARRLLKENPEVEEKLRRIGYDISKLKQDDDES